MRKSSSLRCNPWIKGLCAVLCCLLLGACVGFGGLAYQFWYHYGSNGSYEGVAPAAPPPRAIGMTSGTCSS